MECRTQKGLYFLIIGLIIIMAYNIVTSSIYLVSNDLESMAIISVFGIISFIGAILVIIGAILFLLGRNEFGEKHQKNVMNAVIIFVINIVVVVILTIFIAFYTFSAISSTSEIDATPFSGFIITIAIVGTILGGLMYYFALIELEDEHGKNILFAAIIISIAISIITSIYIAGLMGEMFGSISAGSSPSSMNFAQNAGGIGILGALPSLLFLYALYIPYMRIKNGELIPQIQSPYNPINPSRMCPNCGRPIPNDSLICPYCGRKF